VDAAVLGFVAVIDEFLAGAVFGGGEGIEHVENIAQAEAALDAALSLGGGDGREGVVTHGGRADIALGEGGAGDESAGCEDEECFHGNFPTPLNRNWGRGRPFGKQVRLGIEMIDGEKNFPIVCRS
jgi:hypothetical protein